MKLFSDTVKGWWQDYQDQLIEDMPAIATIHFYPVATEAVNTGMGYDAYFQESTTPSNPTNYDNTTATSVTVTGIYHTDLYGTALDSNERMDLSPIGRINQDTTLLCVRLSDVLLDNSENGTYFDNCEYVTISGYPDRYRVEGVKRRGLGEQYMLDVFLIKWGAEA